MLQKWCESFLRILSASSASSSHSNFVIWDTRSAAPGPRPGLQRLISWIVPWINRFMQSIGRLRPLISRFMRWINRLMPLIEVADSWHDLANNHFYVFFVFVFFDPIKIVGFHTCRRQSRHTAGQSIKVIAPRVCRARVCCVSCGFVPLGPRLCLFCACVWCLCLLCLLCVCFAFALFVCCCVCVCVCVLLLARSKTMSFP